MAERSPLISVITAVYNGESYIRETIESVLKFAADVDFEYIVVNDGSTDSTLGILRDFKDSISIVDQENVGESASVSRAFELSKGAYLLVVSADDPLLTSELFTEVFDWFEEKPDLVAVYPDWQMIDPVGNVIQTVKVPSFSDELLIGHCRTLPGPGVIIRRSPAVDIGGRNSKWVFVGDYDFWLRLSRCGEIRHRAKVLAQWRHHPESTSVSKRGIQMARERIDVIENFLLFNDVKPELARQALGHAYYTAARLTYFSREVPGKQFLKTAFVKRKGWVEEAEISVILFILLDPFSRLLLKPLKFLRIFRIRNL